MGAVFRMVASRASFFRRVSWARLSSLMSVTMPVDPTMRPLRTRGRDLVSAGKRLPSLRSIVYSWQTSGVPSRIDWTLRIISSRSSGATTAAKLTPAATSSAEYPNISIAAMLA